MVRPNVVLPEHGLSHEEVIKSVEEISKDDIEWRDGKVWSLVYHANDEHYEMLNKAYTMFFSKNALSPIAFPSLKKFEIEKIGVSHCTGLETSMRLVQEFGDRFFFCNVGTKIEI